MAAASSVSTYLDVTQAATGAPSTTPTDADPELMARAKVLATIHAGIERVSEVEAKTGLPTDEVLAALAWLNRSGLVDVAEDDGMRAQLTDAAKTALNSS
jgi:hypothetical protein